MKKIVLFAATLFMLLSNNVKAQFEETGQNYVKLQYVQPLGSYRNFYSAGVAAEYGRMFPLPFDIADGMILPGLDITFGDISFNKGREYEYEDFKNIEINGNTINEVKTSGGCMLGYTFKIGPMITVGITEGLVADFAIQYAPTFFASWRKGINPSQLANGLYKDDCSSFSGKFAHRVGFKGGIRYSHFMFGLEFLVGSKTFEYGKAIIPAAYNPTEKVLTTDKNADLGLTTLMLNFGITF